MRAGYYRDAMEGKAAVVLRPLGASAPPAAAAGRGGQS